MSADVAKNLLLNGQVPAQYITGQCPPSCTAGAALVDHNSRTPYAEQANVQIEREIGKGLIASVVVRLFRFATSRRRLIHRAEGITQLRKVAAKRIKAARHS